MKKALIIIVSLTALCFGEMALSEIVITEPADGKRIAQGGDYATYVIGDPWDMHSDSDPNLRESTNLTEVLLSAGDLSFLTVPREDNPDRAAPNLWMLWPGLPIAFNSLERGDKFPIDTTHYQHLAIKVRMSDSEGQPLTDRQDFVVWFMEDANWTNPRKVGVTINRKDTFADWTVLQWDLADLQDMNTNFDFVWTDVPLIRGLRINATNNPDVRVEIDWVRLTSGPSQDTSIRLAWEDSLGSGPYSVGITDGEFIQTVAEDINANSFDLDVSHLPAGTYQVLISDETQTAAAQIAINDVPLLHLVTPSIKGDQSRDYGHVVAGNSWQTMDAGDIAETPDLTNLRYDSPSGSLTARPVSSDPRVLFSTPTPIDADRYRMLCYTIEVKGARDIGLGSIARILWGNDRTNLETTADILVQEGLNEYCVGDLSDIRMDSSEPPGANWDWSGMVDFIRFDPHEFPVSSECQSSPGEVACRDIRLDSFVLAPFNEAEGLFEITWQANDQDDDATISLYYDADEVPFNGNESIIVESLSASVAAGSYQWDSAAVPAGVYRILALIDDGFNQSLRYSTGPVRVLEVDNNAIFQDRFEAEN